MTVEIRANFPPEQWYVEIASMRVLGQNLASHTVIASSSKLDRRSLIQTRIHIDSDSAPQESRFYAAGVARVIWMRTQTKC